MSDITVVAQTQQIDVDPVTQTIEVDPITQIAVVIGPAASAVSVVNAGPIGPPGIDHNAVTYFNHGSNPNAARPNGYAMVIWYGSVQPVNAVVPDIVIRTDEAV